MNNLSIFEGELFAQIRITPDGKGSVLDVIKNIGGHGNPKKLWKTISKQFPEILDKCDYFQFPGRGQRLIPVLDKEGLLQVIGLLPGAAGEKYREGAKNLVLGLLDNPAEVAKSAIDKIDNSKEIEDIATIAYRRYEEKYHPLRDELNKRGAIPPTYQHIDAINAEACFDKETQAINEERSDLTIYEQANSTEFMRLIVVQDLQCGGIVKRNAQGHAEIIDVASKAASAFKALIDEFSIT